MFGVSLCPRSNRVGSQDHRDHAVVGQVIAELKAARWAHLPFGRCAAKSGLSRLRVIAVWS